MADPRVVKAKRAAQLAQQLEEKQLCIGALTQMTPTLFFDTYGFTLSIETMRAARAEVETRLAAEVSELEKELSTLIKE